MSARTGVLTTLKRRTRTCSPGALPHEAIQDVGEGIKVAVTDPFGNVVGLIENPHFTAITEGEPDPPSPRLRRLAPLPVPRIYLQLKFAASSVLPEPL